MCVRVAFKCVNAYLLARQTLENIGKHWKTLENIGKHWKHRLTLKNIE